MLALATAAEPDWAEQGQFFVALVGLILTVAGLAFVWIQVRAIRQEGRADRVSALMARLQDRELLRTRVAALRYVRITSPEECYERLLTWEDAESGETPLMPGHHEPVPSMNDCRHVMLFFEELAGLFNTGAVDVDLAERLFSNIVVETFDQYWWLVHGLREGRVAALQITHRGQLVVKATEDQEPYEDSSNAEWEALARNLHRVKPELHAPARDGIWIICLPPEGEDRVAYRELSRSLSCNLGELQALEAALGVGESQPSELPKTVFCVPPWQLGLDVHLRCQRLAAAIHEKLTDGTMWDYLRPTSSTQVAPSAPHSASPPTPRPPRP